MQFDWTLNVGNLLTIVGLIGTAATLYFAMRLDIKLTIARLTELGGRMINVENKLEELTHLTIQMAESNVRMQAVDERLLEQTRRMNNLDENGSKHVQLLMQRIERIEGQVFRQRG